MYKSFRVTYRSGVVRIFPASTDNEIRSEAGFYSLSFGPIVSIETVA